MINHDIKYEGLTYGQVVKTMGRQVAIPYKHSYTDYGKQGIYPYSFNLVEKEVQGKVCIKLSQVGAEAPEWYINTNKHRQSGLVCWLDTQYEGYAILSIRITKMATRSVYAEPVEYIEVEPRLDTAVIGNEAEVAFNHYADKVDEEINEDLNRLECGLVSPKYRAIWHNKTE